LDHYVLRLEQYQWLMLFVGPLKNLHAVHAVCTACLYTAALTCAGESTTFRGGRRNLRNDRHDR